MRITVELEIDDALIPAFELMAKESGKTWQQMAAIVASNTLALEFNRRVRAYPDFPANTPTEFRDLTASDVGSP